MVKSTLSLRDLRYDESMLHVELVASNGSQLTTQDFYCNQEDLIEFAERLRSFGSSGSEEVVFELGARDPGVAHLVRLRAHLTDRVGHSAIEVDVADNATGWFGHSARFQMLCEPAAVNRLGQLILEWVEDRTEPLEWEARV